MRASALAIKGGYVDKKAAAGVARCQEGLLHAIDRIEIGGEHITETTLKNGNIRLQFVAR